MIGNTSDEMQKNDSVQKNDQHADLNRSVMELTSLLKATRELSNSRELHELHTSLAHIVIEKLEVRKLAIFTYHKNTATFELVFSHGIGDLNLEFETDWDNLWGKTLHSEPFRVTDPPENSIFRTLFDKYDLDRLDSKLWIPLDTENQTTGLLTIGEKADGQAFDDFDLNFLRHIADHASSCISTYDFYRKKQEEAKNLHKTHHNLSLLYNIGRAINYLTDVNSLLQYILTQATKISNAEKGSIMIYNPDANQLNIRILTGLADKNFQDKINRNEVECKSFKPGEGVAGHVFLTGKPIIVNDTKNDDSFIKTDSSFVNSIACIPIIVHGEVLGVINLTNKKDSCGFSLEETEMLKAVADQAAVALDKAKLWEMAFTDSLTGLYDRRYFKLKLHDELQRAKRYNKAFSIVMADLDYFKNINDTFGHAEGDKVLKRIGNYLQESIRNVDLIARYGGDEFVLFFPEKDKDAAFNLSERLRKKISQIRLAKSSKITISLGIASFPADGKDAEDLIQKADSAMYYAKQMGRNKIVAYSEDIKLLLEKNNLSAHNTANDN